MTKAEILHKVFEVHGLELADDRSLYSATVASPVSVLDINKRFGNWSKFYSEYKNYCGIVRQKEAATKKVTKDAKK